MKNKIVVKTMALGLALALAFGQPLTVFAQEGDPSTVDELSDKADKIESSIEAMKSDVDSIDKAELSSNTAYESINIKITDIMNDDFNKDSQNAVEQLKIAKDNYTTAETADKDLAKENYKEKLSTAEETIADKTNEATSSTKSILSATNINDVELAYRSAIAACNEITSLYDGATNAGETVDNLYKVALTAVGDFDGSAKNASNTLSKVQEKTDELHGQAKVALDIVPKESVEKEKIQEVESVIQEYDDAKTTYNNLSVDIANKTFFEQMIEKDIVLAETKGKDAFAKWGKPEKSDFLLKYYLCCENNKPIQSINEGDDFSKKDPYNFVYEVEFADGTSEEYVVVNKQVGNSYYYVANTKEQDKPLFEDANLPVTLTKDLRDKVTGRNDAAKAADTAMTNAETALENIKKTDAYMAYLYGSLETNTSNTIGYIGGAQNNIDTLIKALEGFNVTNIQQSLVRLATAKDEARNIAEQAKKNYDAAIEAINRRNQNNNNNSNNNDDNNDDNNAGNGAGAVNASAIQVQNAVLATNADVTARTVTRRSNVTVAQDEAEDEDETTVENEVIADAEVPTADSVTVDGDATTAEDKTTPEVVKIDDEKTALADAAPLTNEEKSPMPFVVGGAVAALGVAGFMFYRRLLKAARVRK